MPDEHPTALHLVAGEGDELSNPLGGPLTFKARGRETGGMLTAFESTPASGEGPPLHTHADQDELLYFVKGHFRVKLAGMLHDAPSGSVTFIPRNVPHSWQNIGDTERRLFVLFVPAAPGMEVFFERFARIDTAEAAEGFVTLGSDTGMEVLGPPLAQSDPLP